MPPIPSLRAILALVALFRTTMARQLGVRAAQVIGLFALVGFASAMWLLADRYGPDATTLSILSQAALTAVAACGGIAGIAIARAPKPGSDFEGIAALAAARGFSAAEVELCETLAAVRVVAEAVLVPVAAVGVATFLIATGHHVPGTWRAILGAAAFGAVAAASIGLLAAGCRRWGGAKGRSWFVVLIVVPWLVAEIVPPAWGSEYLSIPGLIGRAWDLLALGDA